MNFNELNRVPNPDQYYGQKNNPNTGDYRHFGLFCYPFPFFAIDAPQVRG